MTGEGGGKPHAARALQILKSSSMSSLLGHGLRFVRTARQYLHARMLGRHPSGVRVYSYVCVRKDPEHLNDGPLTHCT